MDDREKAVEKVRKLMSLAENAGNENEAANAFSKARIFMKKYHLELSDIYSAEPSPRPLSRRKTPPRPLTPEERHREMTRLKQQEEQRLREFQKVAEQQQRKRQREGSSRHCTNRKNAGHSNPFMILRPHRPPEEEPRPSDYTSPARR